MILSYQRCGDLLSPTHKNRKEREMKKVLFGLMGALFVVFGANAAETTIRTATTNTVRHKVYDIQYGPSGTVDSYNYRSGYTPQTNKLDAATGTTIVANSGQSNMTVKKDSNDAGTTITVGNLASVSNSGGTVSTNAAVSSTLAPTATVTANTANIAVLGRDKLPVAGDGNCDSTHRCGYVTTGNHANNSTDKVWIKIVDCSNGTCNVQ